MPGAERLNSSSHLQALLSAQAAEDRLVTAICAAPAVVLKPQGLLQGAVMSVSKRQRSAHDLRSPFCRHHYEDN